MKYFHYYRRDCDRISALKLQNSSELRGHGDSISTNGDQGGKNVSGSLNRGKLKMRDKTESWEHLTNIGKTSKRRFPKIANLFSRQKTAKIGATCSCNKQNKC